MQLSRKTKIALGVTGGMIAAGTTVYIVRRMGERRRLASMLDESAIVNEARGLGLISWTSQEKATEQIPLFGSAMADDVFPTLLLQVEKLLPPASSKAPGVVAELSEAVGVTPEQLAALRAKATAVYAKLPDVPGVDISSWLK
jgi:hypothetical protein